MEVDQDDDLLLLYDIDPPNRRRFYKIDKNTVILWAIDGTLINIKTTHENDDDYVDRRRHHSLNEVVEPYTNVGPENQGRRRELVNYFARR